MGEDFGGRPPFLEDSPPFDRFPFPGEGRMGRGPRHFGSGNRYPDDPFFGEGGPGPKRFKSKYYTHRSAEDYDFEEDFQEEVMQFRDNFSKELNVVTDSEPVIFSQVSVESFDYGHGLEPMTTTTTVGTAKVPEVQPPVKVFSYAHRGGIEDTSFPERELFLDKDLPPFPGDRNRDRDYDKPRDRPRDFGGCDSRDFRGRDSRDFGGCDSRDFGGRDSRVFRGRDSKDFGGRDSRDFGGRDSRDFGGRDSRDFGGWETRNFGSRDSRDSSVRESRDFGGRIFKDLGSRDSRDSKEQFWGESGGSNFRDGRDHRGRDFKTQGGRDFRDQGRDSRDLDHRDSKRGRHRDEVDSRKKRTHRETKEDSERNGSREKPEKESFDAKGSDSPAPYKSQNTVFKIEETTLIYDLLFAPKRETRPKQIVIILRGLPGSGKTYVAKLIKDKEVENGGSAPCILSLDDYFMIEVEVNDIDPDTGMKVKRKEFKFEFESEMEETYRSSLFKSFKKTIDDRFFPFIIVDAIHNKSKHYEQYWSYAKQRGFQVYIAEMECNDPNICFKRNTHNRSIEDITKLLKAWESKPSHFIDLDVRSLLQDVAITELSKEYQEVLEKDVVVFEARNEIKILNARYRRPLAEIEVTKCLEPEILPNDPDFLFEWIKKNLEKETEILQNTLANQDEIIEQLHQGKRLLRISGQEDLFAEETSSETESSENEGIMLGLMQRLHRKLARRLKLLVRSNFSSHSEVESSSSSLENSSENNCHKTLYKILKVCFAEVQNQTNFDLSAKPEVTIDSLYPVEHLQLLIDCDVLEVVGQDPLTLSLKEP